MAGSKLHYAIVALIEILGSGGSEPLGARELSKSTGLSKRYLEQVLGLLKKAGIVSSARGKYGGYSLDIPADKLTLDDIWKALREDLSIPAIAPSASEARGSAAVSEFQARLFGEVGGLMRSISLEELADIEMKKSEMYFI